MDRLLHTTCAHCSNHGCMIDSAVKSGANPLLNDEFYARALQEKCDLGVGKNDLSRRFACVNPEQGADVLRKHGLPEEVASVILQVSERKQVRMESGGAVVEQSLCPWSGVMQSRAVLSRCSSSWPL